MHDRWKIALMGGVSIVAFNQHGLILAPAFGQQAVQVIQGGQQLSSTNTLPVTVENTNSNGQATSASSSPVVLPSDQIVSTNLSKVGGTAVSLGQAAMATSIPVALASNQTVGDPCTFQTKIPFPISTSTTGSIISGVSGKKIYVCSLAFLSNASAIVSLIEGTGGTCAGGTSVAVFGSTNNTAGATFPPSGGMTFGNGAGTVLATANATNALCLLQNTTALIGGGGTYVQQ